MEFKPKFKTLVEVYQHATKTFAQNTLFGEKKSGAWRWMTYSEFAAKVDKMRGGLQAAGLVKGDRVAMISNNRPEWAIAAYGCYGLGGAFVPMYESQPAKEWKFILEDCGAKILFVANRDIADKVHGFFDQMESGKTTHPKLSAPSKLETVVLIHGEAKHPYEKTFAEMIGGETADFEDVSGEDIAGFIYTSGTTGDPKGVLLSHTNLASNVSAIHEFFPIGQEDRSLSFLPWAHSFGQTVELHTMFSMGASMGIAEAVDKIVANLGEVRPTLLFSVPRIFNRIYDGLNKKMTDAGGVKLKLFESAVANAETRKKLSDRKRRSGWVDFKHGLFDKVVFAKVRERFGGRLKYAFSGGAALSKEVAQFVDNLGITVYEGYGLTETSPIATANSPSGRKIGSVGRPIPGVKVEIDTAVTGDAIDGEIVIYGHNIMQGYYGLEKANQEVLLEKDGERGFRSGDMGRLDEDGFLYITGRIKEQYKLQNGKYVVPTPLEEKLKLSAYISNCMIYGMNKPNNIALIIPDFEALGDWAKQQGLPTAPEQLVQEPQVRALFQRELDRWSEDFKGYERAKNFALGTTDFSPDNGMLTPTLKLKRREVLKQYGAQIDALFEG